VRPDPRTWEHTVCSWAMHLGAHRVLLGPRDRSTRCASGLVYRGAPCASGAVAGSAAVGGVGAGRWGGDRSTQKRCVCSGVRYSGDQSTRNGCVCARHRCRLRTGGGTGLGAHRVLLDRGPGRTPCAPGTPTWTHTVCSRNADLDAHRVLPERRPGRTPCASGWLCLSGTRDRCEPHRGRALPDPGPVPGRHLRVRSRFPPLCSPSRWTSSTRPGGAAAGAGCAGTGRTVWPGPAG
jgi:hypothetical protein